MGRRVSAHEFVKVWQESRTVSEVARKIGSKNNACRVRAFRYRKMGVPLKEHQFVEVPNIDWQKLARYAAEVLPQPKEGNEPLKQ